MLHIKEFDGKSHSLVYSGPFALMISMCIGAIYILYDIEDDKGKFTYSYVILFVILFVVFSSIVIKFILTKLYVCNVVHILMKLKCVMLYIIMFSRSLPSIPEA